MSTAVTQFRPAESLPSHAQPLGLTASLAYHVAGASVADGHYSPVQGQPSRADITEAKAALPRCEHLCRRGSPMQIASWLEKFRTLPKAPTDRTASQEIAAAMAFANGDLPAAVWTAKTAAEGLRRFRFYPSPAEVRELLEPHARGFWRQRDGLRRVVEWSEPPVTQREPVTPEVAAHVGNLVRAFVAERSFHQSASENTGRAPVRPRPLDPVSLAAVYRKAARDGDKAAEIRLRMIDPRVLAE